MEFNDLPSELKIEIFSYLDAKQLCTSVIPVCTQWQEIARDAYLWTTFSVDGSNVKPWKMIEILNQSYLVRNLKLCNFKTNWNWLDNLTVEHRALRTLTIFDSKMNSYIVSKLVKQFPSVERLQFKDCWFDYHCICEVVQWESLKSLSLLGPATCMDMDLVVNVKMTDWYEVLTLIGQKLQQLEEFDLMIAEMYTNDKTLINFMEYRKDTIKKLGLLCPWICEGYESLSLAPHLTSLTLHDPKYLEDLCFYLQDFKSLNEFTVKYTEYNSQLDDRFSIIFHDNIFPHLSSLTIDACYWDLPEDIVDLVSQSCPELRKLVLASGCFFATTTTFRDLSWLKIEDFDGQYFKELPSKLPKLTCLDLACNSKKNIEVLEEVKEKMPNLQIILRRHVFHE